MRSTLRCLVLVAATALVLLGTTGPTHAHPFGDPQTMELSLADDGGRGGETVQVHWRIGMSDDLSWLALHLGLLPQDRVMLDGAMWYEDGDGDLLLGAVAFEEYLLDHISVVSDGESCTGTVTAKRDLLAEGATLRFDCPSAVVSAVVESSMLTDLHPAYRTMATGPDGQRFVYDGDHPTREWIFDPTAARATHTVPGSTDRGRSAALQLGGVLGGIGVAGVFAGLIRRRRRGTPRRGARGSATPAGRQDRG